MFAPWLYHMRAEGIPVGVGEWIGWLDALQQGVAADVDALYAVGRAYLCRSEADFDRYDVAFVNAFEGAELRAEVRERLQAWLDRRVDAPRGEWVDPGMDDDELWNEFLKRLKEQTEEHHGGNRWIGTGGTSPFGHSGRAARGIRVGGAGGQRRGIVTATERRWENYRRDRVLDVRSDEVAWKALRRLVREGRWELDLQGTIQQTCRQGGEIDIVERRERENQVRLVLLMDAGGSMTPHHERVSRLFSAAHSTRQFKSFDAYAFHNCVYGWLYSDISRLERVRTEAVLRELTPRHRVVFVGDACMAPYELFAGQAKGHAGIDWLQRIRRACPSSVWLNPDSDRYWGHTTVNAIGQVFPMFELTVDGLRAAIHKLRAPI